jgi:hypothetical protein
VLRLEWLDLGLCLRLPGLVNADLSSGGLNSKTSRTKRPAAAKAVTDVAAGTTIPFANIPCFFASDGVRYPMMWFDTEMMLSVLAGEEPFYWGA